MPCVNWAPSVSAGKYRDDKKSPHWSGLFRAVLVCAENCADCRHVGNGRRGDRAGCGMGIRNACSRIHRRCGHDGCIWYCGGAAGNVILGLVQGFAWVTIIFAVIERCSVKIDIREATAGAWKPEDLADKPVPAEKAMLKREIPSLELCSQWRWLSCSILYRT